MIIKKTTLGKQRFKSTHTHTPDERQTGRVETLRRLSEHTGRAHGCLDLVVRCKPNVVKQYCSDLSSARPFSVYLFGEYTGINKAAAELFYS